LIYAVYSRGWWTHHKQPVPKGDYVLGDIGETTWALHGTGMHIAIKVLDGPKGKTPRDGVHVFLDTKHDRGVIYHAHDVHFFVPRDYNEYNNHGNVPIVQGMKKTWDTKARVKEIEGGYIMELGFNEIIFTGNGQWLQMVPGSVYGFDIAVDEGTEGNVSQQIWRGDAKDAENTSHFGTIVLTNERAVPLPPEKK
jgi:hypothetical protein